MKKFKITDKDVKKLIKKATKKGYDELAEFVAGTTNVGQFIQFINGMGECDIQDTADQMTANMLYNSINGLIWHLFQTEQITQDELDQLENALMSIPYDDSI